MLKGVRAASLGLVLFAPQGAAAQATSAFATTCAACHGQNAEGIPGFAPPLKDTALWTQLGAAAPEYLAGVMISGLSGTIEAAGQTYAGMAMPAQAQLSDKDLLAIAEYVLREVNGLELTLTPEVLAAARASPPTHEALLELRDGGQ